VAVAAPPCRVVQQTEFDLDVAESAQPRPKALSFRCNIVTTVGAMEGGRRRRYSHRAHQNVRDDAVRHCVVGSRSNTRDNAATAIILPLQQRRKDDCWGTACDGWGTRRGDDVAPHFYCIIGGDTVSGAAAAWRRAAAAVNARLARKWSRQPRLFPSSCTGSRLTVAI
jgi:hypothetical protein